MNDLTKLRDLSLNLASKVAAESDYIRLPPTIMDANRKLFFFLNELERKYGTISSIKKQG